MFGTMIRFSGCRSFVINTLLCRRRSGMLFSTFALGLILAWQTAPVFSASNPGTTLQGPIRGKTNWSYQVSLAAGEFAELQLEQQGIDLSITVTDPVQNTF